MKFKTITSIFGIATVFAGLLSFGISSPVNAELIRYAGRGNQNWIIEVDEERVVGGRQIVTGQRAAGAGDWAVVGGQKKGRILQYLVIEKNNRFGNCDSVEFQTVEVYRDYVILKSSTNGCGEHQIRNSELERY